MQKNNEIIYDNSNTYSGFKGKIIITFMNLLHKSVHNHFVSIMDIQKDNLILDIGCGGGNLIKQMAKKTDNKVCAIDYSKDMVLASKKNNRINIANGIVEIKEASVSDIPYQDNSFDKISIFETIQFWPDIENDLKEVYRVTKPGGKLYLMNRMAKETSKWYEWSKLKNKQQYKTAIEGAGFSEVDLDITSKSGWIIATAKKTLNICNFFLTSLTKI